MKKHYPAIIIVLAAATLLFGFEKKRDLNINANGLQKMEVDAGAGSLKIVGVKGLHRIKVQATIRADRVSDNRAEKFIRENIELKLERHGKSARLISKTKNGFWRNVSAAIDLTVEVPQRLNLEVRDGSGSLEIQDIDGYLDLIDGSGSIRLARIGGDTQVEDGSGSTGIEQIGGNLELTDGSGGVKIEGVKGNVEVKDGSGGLQIRDIRGDVEVEDGSGGMEIIHVGGNVTIYDGSGSITIRNVRRDVRIKEAGSGGVTIQDVKGKVYGRKDR